MPQGSDPAGTLRERFGENPAVWTNVRGRGMDRTLFATASNVLKSKRILHPGEAEYNLFNGSAFKAQGKWTEDRGGGGGSPDEGGDPRRRDRGFPGKRKFFGVPKGTICALAILHSPANYREIL